MIFLCMILRRFPWKIPDPKNDVNFRAFVNIHPDLNTKPPARTNPPTPHSTTPPRRNSNGSAGDSASSTNPTSSREDSVETDLTIPSSQESAKETTRLPHGPRFNSASSAVTLSILPDDSLSHSDSPQEMDPSVLTFGRPAMITESAPASPTVNRTFNLITPTPPASKVLSPQFPPTAGGLVPPAPGMKVRSVTSPVPLSPTTPRASQFKTTASSSNLPAASKSSSQTQISAAARNRANSGATDSIFRLLPRETRECIRRMMHIEPTGRTTLSDLLVGKGKAGGLVCKCGGAVCGGDLNRHATEHEDDGCGPIEEEDEGDDWLKSIVPCSAGCAPDHSHIKVTVDEKPSKKKFF